MSDSRLFIGLRVPADVGGRALELATAGLEGRSGVRLYAPQDLHVTLCFLGPQPVAAQARLAGALRDETRGLAAPELGLRGVGTFPDEGAPRVLWAGVDEEPGTEGRLHALRNRALTAALGAGWRMPEAERRRGFRPHVTLARLADGAATDPWEVLERFEGQRPRGTWIVTDIALFESRPDRPEERYRALAEVPLAVRPG